MAKFATHEEQIAFEQGRDAARREAAFAAGRAAGGQASAAPTSAGTATARPASTALAASGWDDVAAKLNKRLGVSRPTQRTV